MNKHTSSFQAKMKEQAQQRQKRAEQFFVALAAQLILDESLFEHQREKLSAKIDIALERNDYKSFVELSEQFKKYQNN
ncbi:IDEAL domain-containing protein [Pseudalkalibacillus berkeleyi]|uniref:IDEAL domain-containing protein n=1 Tax=Pseudalkalibacillus berkeleyi TaxID=1069813 RepID=A0ABS9GYR6_9BACL|nr:IDEAL domain-containing protein [Pseudalkalibacillus berkeleyi]MCF6136743.1 IDEAL domain-containing protein [Pseudalkalibacillus berkeleyi]